jgi:hypothetical protein
MVPQNAAGDVAQVRLEEDEVGAVGHPHAQHLVVLAVDDPPGGRALLGPVGCLPELHGQLVDDRIVDPEEVLGGLRVHVRCMFESNFPVDKASCSYTVLWNSFKRLTAPCSAGERAKLFHDTAARVYRLADAKAA